MSEARKASEPFKEPSGEDRVSIFQATESEVAGWLETAVGLLNNVWMVADDEDVRSSIREALRVLGGDERREVVAWELVEVRGGEDHVCGVTRSPKERFGWERRPEYEGSRFVVRPLVRYPNGESR